MQESWVMLRGSSRGRWILLIVFLCVVVLGMVELWQPQILTATARAIISGIVQLGIWIRDAMNSWSDFFKNLSNWSR